MNFIQASSDTGIDFLICSGFLLRREGVNMKSMIYCDAILAQSNISMLHRGEEREEIFETTSRVKSN